MNMSKRMKGKRSNSKRQFRLGKGGRPCRPKSHPRRAFSARTGKGRRT
jgi:hypothetical protein